MTEQEIREIKLAGMIDFTSRLDLQTLEDLLGACIIEAAQRLGRDRTIEELTSAAHRLAGMNGGEAVQ